MGMLVNPGLHELLLVQVKPRLLDVANLVNVLWHIASFKLVKPSVVCFFVYGIDDCKPVPEEFRPFLNALLVTLAAHERRSANARAKITMDCTQSQPGAFQSDAASLLPDETEVVLGASDAVFVTAVKSNVVVGVTTMAARLLATALTFKSHGFGSCAASFAK
ncbi:hypothetical protein ACCO45_012825 [Purpureocillium lilacinum]|uniref:Uncharacterized protein n=1 Tax=Purpureocillium lilacinum TaxID=33203 RepID=A0ACC4D924_PURLI